MLDLSKKKRQEGFTIIEVMIVLAIAGLIMVIVFLAIPQLQRSQRNTKAKDVVNRMKASLEEFAGNNNGKYPWDASSGAWSSGTTYNLSGTTADATFASRYLKNVDVKNPRTGNDMKMLYTTTIAQPAPDTDVINVTRSSKCDGETVITVSPASSRQYTLSFALEGGAVYCVDNG